jgi:hypothetical protein
MVYDIDDNDDNYVDDGDDNDGDNNDGDDNDGDDGNDGDNNDGVGGDDGGDNGSSRGDVCVAAAYSNFLRNSLEFCPFIQYMKLYICGSTAMQ